MQKLNRKKLIIILVALGLVVLVYFSFYMGFVSGLLGFIAGKVGGGTRAGLPGRMKSVVIPWRKYRLHLHHWLITSALIAVCAVTGFYIVSQQLFFGFMSGLVIQGVYCYEDWHRIVWVNIELPGEDFGENVSENLEENLS